MTVELLNPRCGHRPVKTPDGKTSYVDFAQSVGDVVDVDDAEAKRMIERGFAKAARQDQKKGGN